MCGSSLVKTFWLYFFINSYDKVLSFKALFFQNELELLDNNIANLTNKK